MRKLFLAVVLVSGAAAACERAPTAPLHAPASPRLTLSGSISGPSAVKPNATCMWETAGGSGGTAPYDYSWLSSQGDWANGTMQFYATAPSSGFMVITLTITDANLDERTVRKTVSISPSAPVCIPS